MGCFSLFPCFTSSKHPKLNKSVNPTAPASSSSSALQGYEKNCETVLIKVPTQESTNIGSLQTPVRISRDNSEGQVINENDSKTSVIDLDVEILSVESEEKKENGKLGIIMQIENERKKEKLNNEGVQVEIENDNKKDMEVEDESDKEKEMKTEVPSRAISDSSVSSYISYPPMHRYGNHVTKEDADQVVIQEESSESLFSLSVNPRKQSINPPVDLDDKEVNSPLKTSSSPKMVSKTIKSCPNEDADSLLNPIENLAQWKTLKSIPPTPVFDLHQEKKICI
ncbi:putative protein JASON [Helianthus annuus]|nr:putative protein JASON [Helianthus annuus]